MAEVAPTNQISKDLADLKRRLAEVEQRKSDLKAKVAAKRLEVEKQKLKEDYERKLEEQKKILTGEQDKVQQLQKDVKQLLELQFPGPTPKMVQETGEVKEGDHPVEMTDRRGYWKWEVGPNDRPAACNQWLHAIEHPYDDVICSSPPVLMPAILGGWKLMLQLKIKGDLVELHARLDSSDMYNKGLLRDNGGNEQHLRNNYVLINTKWYNGDGSGILLTSGDAGDGETAKKSLWDLWRNDSQHVATVPIRNLNAQRAPIVSLHLHVP